jgi:hypothetical protein
MDDAAFEAGFKAGIAAAVKFCEEGRDNLWLRAERARDSGDERGEDRCDRVANTWSTAAEMIAQIKPPPSQTEEPPLTTHRSGDE